MAADKLSCWVCATDCQTYKKLKKHYKKEHQEYDLICCLFCKFVTVSQADIRKHKKQEHPKDTIHCSLCQFSTTSWNKWKQHEGTDHQGENAPDATSDPHESPSCQGHHASRHVDSSVVGSSPMRLAHELGQITDQGGDSLSTNIIMSARSLDAHSLPSHGNSSNHKPGQGSHSSPSHGNSSNHKSGYHCELCKKQFAKKINLTYHMRTHTNDRPFQCKFCDYASCLKTTLDQHIRGHLGIKPYKCQVCEYSTAYKSNLVFHAVKHSIERPFSCHFCKKKFKRKDHMNNHERCKHADYM